MENMKFWVLLISLLVSEAAAFCSNHCNGHGLCNKTTLVCDCYSGWKGPDCSLRTCPTGRAWSDFATADDVAHASNTECSNMGICDHGTGKCSCREGFEGRACERLSCPNQCSGRGRCLTMRQAAEEVDGRLLLRSTSYNEWDADMIQGCICDEGFSGHDCSRRSCPTGDDPLTTGQTDDVVTISCTCPGTCSGTFALSYQGHTTEDISYDATELQIESALEAIKSIDQAAVQFTGGSAACDADGVVIDITLVNYGYRAPISVTSALESDGGSVTISGLTVYTIQCSCGSCAGEIALKYDGRATGNIAHDADASSIQSALSALETLADVEISVTQSAGRLCSAGGATTSITFTSNQSLLRPVGLISGLGGSGPSASISISSAHGTKETEPCSNRGICDVESGICTCLDGFEGSDGANGPGSHGDCGHEIFSEQQIIWTEADTGETISDGGFILNYDGETTATIAYNADTATVEAALEALSSTPSVSVSRASSSIVNGGYIWTVTFLTPTGDVNLLTLDSETISATWSGPGDQVKIEGRVEGTVAACPVGGTPAVECAGHGSCSGGPTYTCTCHDGWGGANCEKRLCPVGRAWFHESYAGGIAHNIFVECSNMGNCDYADGTCKCAEGFTGAACERLSCPISSTSKTCSGHGRCRSMKDLAKAATLNGESQGLSYGAVPNKISTWDRDMIFGCLCDEDYYWGVDASNSISYDCSKRACRSGDNPVTTDQDFEVQKLECDATGGSFQLTFRGKISQEISYDATSGEVQSALNALASVGHVDVSVAEGVACGAGGHDLRVTFRTELGDVPLLSAATDSLTGSIAISELVVGTKELLECSHQGLCGFSSGDGSGLSGSRGDCGARTRT